MLIFSTVSKLKISTWQKKCCSWSRESNTWKGALFKQSTSLLSNIVNPYEVQLRKDSKTTPIHSIRAPRLSFNFLNADLCGLPSWTSSGRRSRHLFRRDFPQERTAWNGTAVGTRAASICIVCRQAVSCRQNGWCWWSDLFRSPVQYAGLFIRLRKGP